MVRKTEKLGTFSTISQRDERGAFVRSGQRGPFFRPCCVAPFPSRWLLGDRARRQLESGVAEGLLAATSIAASKKAHESFIPIVYLQVG